MPINTREISSPHAFGPLEHSVESGQGFSSIGYIIVRQYNKVFSLKELDHLDIQGICNPDQRIDAWVYGTTLDFSDELVT